MHFCKLCTENCEGEIQFHFSTLCQYLWVCIQTSYSVPLSIFLWLYPLIYFPLYTNTNSLDYWSFKMRPAVRKCQSSKFAPHFQGSSYYSRYLPFPYEVYKPLVNCYSNSIGKGLNLQVNLEKTNKSTILDTVYSSMISGLLKFLLAIFCSFLFVSHQHFLKTQIYPFNYFNFGGRVL